MFKIFFNVPIFNKLVPNRWVPAGLICFTFNNDKACIHLLIFNKKQWRFGHCWEDYDSVCRYFGFGPLFLIVW